MNHPNRERIYHLVGWSLFVVSSLFYMAASLRSGDWISLLGGFFFFVACWLFLIPMFLE